MACSVNPARHVEPTRAFHPRAAIPAQVRRGIEAGSPGGMSAISFEINSGGVSTTPPVPSRAVVSPSLTAFGDARGPFTSSLTVRLAQSPRLLVSAEAGAL